MDEQSPELFQRLLAARLRENGWLVEEVAPLQIRIGRDDADDITLNLGNLYAAYQNGASLDPIAETVLQLLDDGGLEPETDAPLDLQRLMPLLKPREFLREVERSRVEAIVWRPFITDDVIVTLVIDADDSVRYVREREAEASGQSLDDLLETALANLIARTGGDAYEVGGAEGSALFVLATQDGYDATRILLKPLLERLASKVKGELVIGIPNRDFLVAFGSADPAMVAAIGRQVALDAQSRPHPLTNTLFTFRSGQLERYGPARHG
ncbi:MAG: DUF1444 family protein [Chloroflexi bacterium]|nr:DUF1444 family protein [Chloroflexota bacterium]